LARGRGALPGVASIEVSLSGSPRWVVAVPAEEGSLWAVALDDGRVEAWRVSERRVEPVAVVPDRLPPGAPPLLRLDGGEASLVVAPAEASASTLTHPALLSPSGRMAFVDERGELVIWGAIERGRLALNALPDARLLVDEGERILLLTDATGRYGHGVLGDAIEGGAISLVEAGLTVDAAPRVLPSIPVPAPAVVEGLSPIWADLTGDGRKEIVATVSDGAQGARIVAWNEGGTQIAAGPAIGRGNRWRHQIAVAPFGPQGEIELVAVLTPHIGGVVEFYRLEGEALRIVASVGGYTSHRIGSRNLDQAVACDANGDGQVELVLPNQRMDALGGIQRTGDGAAVAWTVPVGGRISTNLAAVTVTGERLAVGVGREDGVLLVWPPE
jgi:hypothetical protein